MNEALPTQGGSETLGLLSARVMPNRTNATLPRAGRADGDRRGRRRVRWPSVLSSGVMPFRKNTVPTTHAEPMPTVHVRADPRPAHRGRPRPEQRLDRRGQVPRPPLDKPLGTVVGSAVTQDLLFSGWYKQNGSKGTETAPHPLADPFGTLTSRDTTALLTADFRAALDEIALEDCYFRMMMAHEVGRGCGFDVDFAGDKGSFVVWGSARDQVDGYGNAVSPQVGEWIGERLREALHGETVAA